MRKPCSILFLCVLVGFGVSVAVPAEDMPETAYDESEAVPFVSTPVFSLAVPKVLARDGKTLAAVLPLGSLRRRAKRGIDQRIDLTYRVSDSLTILDHSLRC